MTTQDQSTNQRRRQWLVAAAAVGGIAILVFILLKPERPPHQAELPPDDQAAAAPPKFVNQGTPAEETAAALVAPAAPPANMAACVACEQKNRGGKCVKDMGCDGLQGEDRSLCEKLLTCLLSRPECYQQNPAHCYCGTAKGLACVDAPQGVCIKEALAATKTTMKESAIRFFRPEFPSGRASQVAACRVRACKQECGSLASL